MKNASESNKVIAMGGGTPRNKQNNKAKLTPSKRAKLSGVGVGGAAVGGETPKNACVIAFDAILNIGNVANPPVTEDEIHFVPSDTANTFDVWFGSTQLGIYSGLNAPLMWRCANEGFEYHGKIASLQQTGDGIQLSCRVETFTRE